MTIAAIDVVCGAGTASIRISCSRLTCLLYATYSFAFSFSNCAAIAVSATLAVCRTAQLQW